MSKRALGRGLDSLLPRQCEAPSSVEKAQPHPSEASGFGRGFETLLAGSKERTREPVELRIGSVVSARRQAGGQPTAFRYAIADGVLLLISIWLMLGGNGAPGWGRIAGAAFLVILGCVIGLIPLMSTGHEVGEEDAERSDWALVTSPAPEGVRRYLVHLTRPVFVGEIVCRDGREDKVVPLWIEQGIDAPAQAVEQLVGRLHQLPRKKVSHESLKDGALRNLLIRA